MNKLQLDHSAVAKLFPPGSEAELTLTNAVVLEFIKKSNLVKALTAPQIQHALKTGAEQHQKWCIDALANAKAEINRKIETELGLLSLTHVGSQPGRPTAVLSDKDTGEVSAEARRSVNEAFNTLMTEKVAERIKTLQESGKIEEYVDDQVRKLLDGEIAARMKSVLASLSFAAK